MCDPITITALTLTAAAGISSAYGQYKEGVAQKKYYDYMADSSRAEGEYQYKTGEKQAELIQDKAKAEGKSLKVQGIDLAATQKAAMAANGIDLSSVTAQDIASDTMSKSKLDELTLRYNADINSWNTMETAKYNRWASNVQADQYNLAGKNAKRAGKAQAFTTLLGTAASMATMGMLAGAGGASTTGNQFSLKGALGNQRTNSFLVR